MIEEDEHVDKWLITTATVSDDTLELAKRENVSVMDGKKLVDWIYDRINELSPSTKEQLGVGILPQIIYDNTDEARFNKLAMNASKKQELKTV